MTGLHIEGARWSIKHNSLAKSLPNVLTEPLPILAIIPIEEHRLELQVLANLFSITEDVLIHVLSLRQHTITRT